MAEEELTQTGIRVGRWLPAVPGDPARAPDPAAVPRRFPDDGFPSDQPAADPIPDRAGREAVQLYARQPDAGWPGAGPVPAPPVAWAASPPPADPAVATPPAAAVSPAVATPPADGPPSAAAGGMAARPANVRGPATDRRRAAVDGAPAGPATRVGAARVRRRRRRAVQGAAVVAAAVLLLVYAGWGPRSDRGRRMPAAVPAPPTAATSSAAPAAARTTVPVTGAPAFPGGPLLSVDEEHVPAMVDLTALGARDWIHWGMNGGDTVQRKQAGTGEISDPGGERLQHGASVAGFGWTDGTPAGRQDGTRYGVFQRGAGKAFSLAVAGSGDLRTVRFFAGTFSAGARLELRLSGGGGVATREVPQVTGDRFVEYVIHFRAPRGTRLLVTWRALGVAGGENDGVSMEALTVS
ncbi:hypothetical protein [Micromonospora inositola]|uniref:Uncharacterized protein n=1 Tax=Micromonospora inositola TaxID=47865 RepID=A0A1C5GZL6_9ACTN|nr:hypothetical protein [Micromonospora inositola]SCG39235.1 hypothetical protein GA0070613_0621 [Micromonospora inositola]